MVLLRAAAQVCGQMDRRKGEDLAKFNLSPPLEEHTWHPWTRSCGDQLWISESHTDPSPTEQGAPIPKLHRRLLLGDGEDLGAPKLERQCHTGDMAGCSVARGQVGTKAWEATREHELGVAERREWVDGVCWG